MATSVLTQDEIDAWAGEARKVAMARYGTGRKIPPDLAELVRLAPESDREVRILRLIEYVSTLEYDRNHPYG